MTTLSAAGVTKAARYEDYQRAHRALLGEQIESRYDTNIAGLPISLIALFRVFQIPTRSGGWAVYKIKKLKDAIDSNTLIEYLESEKINKIEAEKQNSSGGFTPPPQRLVDQLALDIIRNLAEEERIRKLQSDLGLD